MKQSSYTTHCQNHFEDFLWNILVLICLLVKWWKRWKQTHRTKYVNWDMNRSYYCELIKLIGGHVVLGHSFHSKFIPLNFDPLLKIDQWAFYYLVFCPPHTLLSSKCYNQETWET